MLKSKSLPILAGATALGVAAVFASPARATPCPSGTQFCSQLGASNISSMSTGDFGSVAITILSSNNAQVTFTAASGLSFINSEIADVNGPTSFTAVTSGITQGTEMGNVDGFGSFTLKTDGTPSVPFSTITFDVDGTFGTNAAAVLVANGSGFDAAAHMIGATVNGGNTFFAAEVVPAPLIGHGLFVLLAVGGVLFGGKLLERSKKHPSLGTATPHVPA